FPNRRLRDDAEFGRGRALVQLGKHEEALPLFKKVATNRNSARAADAQFAMGSVLFSQHEYAAAAAAFEQVVADFPQHTLVPLASLNAGYAYYSLKDFSIAIAHFQSAEESEEHQNTARYWIGLSQKANGDFRAASATFADLLSATPDRS